MELIGYPSIVVAGSWNRRILMPNWFLDQFSDLPKNEEINPEMEINSGVFRFVIKEIEIQPHPTKLILSATKREDSTYELAEVLAEGTVLKLRHTPFLGVGHNLEYSINKKEMFTLFSDDVLDTAESFYKDKAGAIALNQYESIHRVNYEDYILSLTYHITKQEKKVLFNYHYPTVEYEKILEYVKYFRKNIENSKELISTLVK